jgi:hypothetical protein
MTAVPHMMLDHAAHAGYQAERLSIDLLYLRVEVGQQQPGQLKAALIHHKPTHCRRRVRAGVGAWPCCERTCRHGTESAKSASCNWSSGNSCVKPSSYRTQATGSDTFSRAPDCATMGPDSRDKPEPLLTKSGFCSSGAHDHPELLTDLRILHLL